MTNHPKTLFIFPGQGSQYPGIGNDLYVAYTVVRDTYDEASEVLGYDISELSFRDPDGAINLTRHTQPVLLTHSVACLRVFNELTNQRVTPSLAAGHSLGEYSALVAAGGLSFTAALALVKSRGELMGELGEGEMAALTLEVGDARSLADQHYCGVAACNLRDQTVVGGAAEDLDALAATMKERFPRKRSTRLKTEGAFHTYYMVEAARRFRTVLAGATFAEPSLAVLSNYTGGNHDSDADSIRSKLFLQLFNPVLWHDNLRTAAAIGVERIIEFGGGLGKGETPAEKRPNLEGIVKKTFRGAEQAPQYYPVINLATLRETAESLGG
ncbi:MAG: ACP S-malonyltransferase [Pseudomonadota bacterium]|nr:ACP S-malonyltransferase [Pseudomonadota bacterium]